MKKIISILLLTIMVISPSFSDYESSTALLTQEQIITLNKFYYDYEKTFNSLLVNEKGEMDGYEYVNHPNMAIKQFEINKILVAYALEHDLYAHVRYAEGEFGTVSLYRCIEDYNRSYKPFFTISFRDIPIAQYDDNEYTMYVDVYSLHNFKRLEGETRKQARQRLVDSNFETDYIISALKDSLAILFEDLLELQLISDSVIGSYHETIDKFFNDWEDDYLEVSNYKVLRGKKKNEVIYYFEYNFEGEQENE